MRLELLFLRWLLAIALVALGIAYVRSAKQAEPARHYETIPLVRGGESSGMPLAGIMIDPARRDIYAVVGGPKRASSGPGFFVIWTADHGGHAYATVFGKGQTKPDAIFQISPTRQIEAVNSFGKASTTDDPQFSQRLGTSEALLRSVLDSLPSYPMTAKD